MFWFSRSLLFYVYTCCLRAQSLSCQAQVQTEISKTRGHAAKCSVLQQGLRPFSWLVWQDSSVKSSAITDLSREFDLVVQSESKKSCIHSLQSSTPFRGVAVDGGIWKDLSHAANQFSGGKHRGELMQCLVLPYLVLARLSGCGRQDSQPGCKSPLLVSRDCRQRPVPKPRPSDPGGCWGQQPPPADASYPSCHGSQPKPGPRTHSPPQPLRQ